MVDSWQAGDYYGAGYQAGSLGMDLLVGAAFAAIGGGSAGAFARGTRALKHACGFKSFSATTHVLMADGTTKPIADIREGDLVQAADPETGEAGPRAVTAVWAHDDQLFTLDTTDGSVVTTEDHPFWNETDRQWQRVDDINPGDSLLAYDGTSRPVIGIRNESGHAAKAYNLTIGDIRTYYVIAGDTPVLVHNCGTRSAPFPNLRGNLQGELALADRLGVRPVSPSEAGFDAALPLLFRQWLPSTRCGDRQSPILPSPS